MPDGPDRTRRRRRVQRRRRAVSLLPGGWAELRASNRALALRGRDLLCGVLGIEPPAPETMIGSIASVPLPLGNASFAIEPGAERDPLQVELFDRHRIEVPIMTWPVPAALEPGRSPEARLLRISAQAYNEATQYERLARAVGHALGGTSGTTATAE